MRSIRSLCWASKLPLVSAEMLDLMLAELCKYVVEAFQFAMCIYCLLVHRVACYLVGYI